MLNNYQNVVKFYIESKDKDGKKTIDIDNSKVIEFWESLGYRKIVNSTGEYTLVKIENKCVVSEVSTHVLRDEIRSYTEHINRNDVWSMFLNREYLVKKLYEPIKTISICTSNGNNQEGFLFYKNNVLKISRNEVVPIEYNDFEGYIWRDQIIQRYISIRAFDDSVFQAFLMRISNDEDTRFQSLISIIGYLIHTYKDSSITKAIILMDSEINPEEENANGGTGKSLIGKAIGNIIPSLFVNGKTINPKDKFFLSGLKSHHKIMFIDDVPRSFDFEGLYSIITGDMPIEKKYKNANVIKFEDSPKILISTNYVISGSGGNAEKRRKIEFEVSSYFKNVVTPLEEFDQRLFDDWDEIEWLKFDNLMIQALQYYLKKGLIPPKPINSNINRLIFETNSSFIEFMDNLFVKPELFNPKIERHNLTFDKKELLGNFIKSDYEISERITPIQFKKWIDKYCEYHGIKYDHKKSNGNILIKFIGMYKLKDKEDEYISEIKN